MKTNKKLIGLFILMLSLLSLFLFIACDSACDHIATEWKITQEASCTYTGTKILFCSACGETIEEQSIPATNHTYSETIVTNATCTLKGKKEYKCSICDDFYEQITPPEGHTFESQDDFSDICRRCGETSFITAGINALTGIYQSLDNPQGISVSSIYAGRLKWENKNSVFVLTTLRKNNASKEFITIIDVESKKILGYDMVAKYDNLYKSAMSLAEMNKKDFNEYMRWLDEALDNLDKYTDLTLMSKENLEPQDISYIDKIAREQSGVFN